jgi:hypothetical protein
MLLYVIYDVLAEECGPIFEAKNDAVAARQYRNVMASRKAGDQAEYQLHCVGDIDELQMAITPCRPSRRVEVNPVEVKDAGT